MPDPWISERRADARAAARLVPTHCAMIGLLLVTLSVVVAGCTTASASVLQGRWQRVSPGSLGEPTALMQEYIELRPGGDWVSLLRDGGTGQYWAIRHDRYSVPAAGRLQVEGICYHGWAYEDCSRLYSFVLHGNRLKVFDPQYPEQAVEFKWIASVSKSPLPTLAPPQPSPTPVAQP
jgi:hypothetical protein